VLCVSYAWLYWSDFPTAQNLQGNQFLSSRVGLNVDEVVELIRGAPGREFSDGAKVVGAARIGLSDDFAGPGYCSESGFLVT
jgi:hypothetical protein